MNQIEKYISDRPTIAESKVAMLKYLAEVSDDYSIEERTKGRSIIKCEFDCGSYKGSEFIQFRISDLNPLKIAVALMSLTSGHHFSYPIAEEELLKQFNRRAIKEQQND